MKNFDFIPQNKIAETSEEHVELICKAIMDYPSSLICDGNNHYAPKSGVCLDEKGNYCWGRPGDRFKKFLFFPTKEEILSALDVFKSKGYFPYYDDEVCYYQVLKSKEERKGKCALLHTRWL